MKRIYFDNAAGTRPDPEVIKEILPFLTDEYGNPSNVHIFGRKTAEALDLARERTASLIGAASGEILFTATGSEAVNLALKGAAGRRNKKKGHIITSEIEHYSTLHTLKSLEKQGFEVSLLPVDKYGLIAPEVVKNAIRPDTFLATFTHASNEIGTISDMEAIGSLTKEHGILFHLDAIQTAGVIPVDLNKLNCDMLSMASDAFHGVRGAAALYVRKGLRLQPQIEGGIQERGIRAGTENIPAIVGMGKAAELARDNMLSRMRHVTVLRNRVIDGILGTISYSRLNGHRTSRLPGNVNVSIEYIEGESMLLLLDAVGIAASSGSACTSRALKVSHVLRGIGLTHETAHGSLLVSLSKDNTMEEVEYLIERIPGIVGKLRAMSPLYEEAQILSS